MRTETRKTRYKKKEKFAKTFPVSLATVNFICDENLGYLVRAAACFGADELCVIGSLPPRGKLNRLSGSLLDYVEIKQFKNPYQFLAYNRKKKRRLVAAEISLQAQEISNYRFQENSCIVVGNEESGIPMEILAAADDIVYIEMPGVGYCLNTAQTANIMMYEYTQQAALADVVKASG